ncbi:MAG: hypothetical protein WCR52_07220 [Bacteroidota bacterium]
MSVPDVLSRIAINVFICIMLFWMIFWDAERENPIRKFWAQKLYPIFAWLGLTSEWKMFAPDPPLRTIWPKVKMTLMDGNYYVWEPTYIGTLSVFEKMKYKKYHKVYFELASPKHYMHTKRDFIDYLLFKYKFDSPCVKVEVYMVAENVPPFKAKPKDPLVENEVEDPKIYQQLIYTYHPPAEVKQ